MHVWAGVCRLVRPGRKCKPAVGSPYKKARRAAGDAGGRRRACSKEGEETHEKIAARCSRLLVLNFERICIVHRSLAQGWPFLSHNLEIFKNRDRRKLEARGHSGRNGPSDLGSGPSPAGRALGLAPLIWAMAPRIGPCFWHLASVTDFAGGG